MNSAHALGNSFSGSSFLKRILLVLPIPYGPDWGFWTRDAGLMALTLSEMGYDAWLVALGDASTVTEGKPVLPVSLEDLNRPEWWNAQQPDAVVLGTGSAPRHDHMRQAALGATPRVVERLDTDGTRSARLFPKPYFIHAWGAYWDKLPAYACWLAPLLAAARTALLYSLPGLMDVRMVATMRRLPAVSAESPVAAARIQQMFEAFSGAKHRVAMIPHPVNENVIRYNGMPKENQIITVGRWASAQKDFPMLRKVLKGFLQRHPDWRATVVGSGVPARDRVTGDGAEDWQRRMTYRENLTHEQLAVEYSRSKIYLMVSRHESFCIAAAESLCCGCSVVGSCNVPSSFYFAEPQSGGVAATRTPKGFLETLDREVERWTKGREIPRPLHRFGGSGWALMLSPGRPSRFWRISCLGMPLPSNRKCPASRLFHLGNPPLLAYDEETCSLPFKLLSEFPLLMSRLIIESGRTERQYWRDLWRYRELFYVLAWRDISVRYKQTVIGVLWAVVQPLMITLVFTFVFSKLVKLPSEGVPYPLWVFAATLPWQFFAASLAGASQSLVTNSNLISKVYFPRMIVPAGAVVTAMVDFLITFGLFLLMMAWYHVAPTWRFAAVPFLMVLAFMATLGPGLLITALNVKYRDFRYIIPFIIQFGIYISPVGWSSTMVHEKSPEWTWLYSLNPMVGVIDGFRWALLDGKGGASLPSFAQSVAVTALLVLLGVWYFRKTERTFADII